MTEHITRPSERDRWSHCSGYPAFKALLDTEGLLPPEEPNKHAARGTVGHALVEMALRHVDQFGLWDDPSAVVRYLLTQVGHTQDVDDLVVEIDQVLVDMAVECLLVVCRIVNDGGVPFHIFIEEPLASGTPDVVVWFPRLRRLVVIDHKFGAGVTVDARNNPQLQVYAVEARDALGEDVETVDLVISQPAKGHMKVSRHDGSELAAWAEQISREKAACSAPQRRLAAGSWCRWCLCALQCPAVEKAVEDTVAFAESPVQVSGLRADALGRRLVQFEDVLVPYGAALRARLHKGLEVGEYDSGAAGWKVVAKRATRKWKDEDEAADWLMCNGVDELAAYKRTLLSPAQIEKLAKSTGLVLPDVADLTESVSSGTTIARTYDARPAKPRLVALGNFPS